MDFKGYKPVTLRTEELMNTIKDMAKAGVKAIMFGGEGEPLLHKDIVSIVEYTYDVGIDIGITTNGTTLNPLLAERLLPYVKWIKISMNAGNPVTYMKIHRTGREDFYKTLVNVTAASVMKIVHRNNCAIGVQAVVLEDNVNELLTIAEIARSTGADYLVLKPYAPLNLSNNKCEIIQIPKEIKNTLKTLETSVFKIIIRENAFKTLEEEVRSYYTCYAAPFWSYIDSEGNVWGCSAHMGDYKFLYGNIYTNSVADIWLESSEFIVEVNNCRTGCRMHQCNEYLHNILFPSDHVNFI